MTYRSAWRVTDGDLLISRGPCLLHAVILLCSAGGGDITLYEGQDAASGDKIGTFEGANNITRPINFNPPLPCQRGLYLDVGSHITEVFIHYTPLPKNYLFSDG